MRNYKEYSEIHNYASEIFGTIFQRVKYSFLLGLTATLERSDNKHYYIERYCPVLDRVDLSESLEKKFISDFVVYNVPVYMTDAEARAYEKLNKQFHRFFALFEHSLDNAMKAVKDPAYRNIVAKRLNWKEKDVMIFAMNFVRTLQKRKKFLYTLDNKAVVTTAIVKALNQHRIITFSENVDYVKKLHAMTPDISIPYHSKLTKKYLSNMLKLFQDPDTGVRVIHTAKALDEGFNVEGIQCAIIVSGTSTIRQNLQRMGRSLRFVEGKLGIIINLYVPDTQDERWLDKRQKNVPNVFWCKSVKELLQKLGIKDHSSIYSSGDPVFEQPAQGLPDGDYSTLWGNNTDLCDSDAAGRDLDGV